MFKILNVCYLPMQILAQKRRLIFFTVVAYLPLVFSK